MTDQPAPARRLESLDVLRGMTIAGMLCVNNPGSWGHIYWPLEHAAWNGWTFTDLVFPFFLFMVGVAMMFSFPKRLARGESRRVLFLHVVRRAVALMLLGYWGSTWSTCIWPGDAFFLSDHATSNQELFGWFMRYGFLAMMIGVVVLLAGTERLALWVPLTLAGAVAFLLGGHILEYNDPLFTRIANIRIPGVLVRIGWCYLFASAIYFLTPSAKALAYWIVGLLTVYWIWMMYIPIPGFGTPDLSIGFFGEDGEYHGMFSNWCFYIDYHILGHHVWSSRTLEDAAGNLIWSFDPEGILSTMSAVCSVLFGILVGLWLQRKETNDTEKTNTMFVWACLWMLLGLVMSIWMPINKRIWTSSYTVFMAGMGTLCLAMCYHLIDVRGIRFWSHSFRWYGRNAIFAFVASGMMANTMGRIKVEWTNPEGVVETISSKSWIYNNLVILTDGNMKLASFIFAIGFVAFWAGICWVLDKRKIYFKV